MNMAEKMYESDLKKAEISNIKELTNQIRSEKIEPILGKAKELISQRRAVAKASSRQEARGTPSSRRSRGKRPGARGER